MPSHFRSRVSAIYLVLNLVIQALANFGIGWMNDNVFEGPRGIGLSLPVFIVVCSTISAFTLWSGRKALTLAVERSAAA